LPAFTTHRRTDAGDPSAQRTPRSTGRGGVSADRIFISYRRADSGGWARSLHDSLEERLGTGRAFRDVAMQTGVDFHEHVESLLDRCDVLLAVIGKRWASITDADGNRRLDNPDDLVRGEIARALQREDVDVIPVLVDGAQMPTEDELPPDLKPLSRRHAQELTDSRWEYDVEVLTQRLRELLGEKPPRRRWKAAPVRAGLAIAVVLGVGALLWASLKPQGSEAPPTKAAKLSGLTLDRHVSFGQYLDRKALTKAPYSTTQLARRGAFVTFDFKVQGYKGKRLPLRYELIDARTGDLLWQQRDFAITPDAQTDQATWDFWAPLPSGADRRFYAQVQLYDDRGVVPLDRLRTKTFGPPS
jgi:hypothetical protein